MSDSDQHSDTPREHCGRCHLPIHDGNGYVLYLTPDHRPEQRYSVHGECIAEDVAAGSAVRVSAFAYEFVPVTDEDRHFADAMEAGQ